LIHAFGLDEKKDSRVGKLSGGQKQRLAVAIGLVGKPDLLFLDEPTTGLDPQSRLQLWEQVRAFREHGGSVVLTTHYMDEAERLCDTIAIVDHGKVIALGTPSELIASLQATSVVEFVAAPQVDRDMVESVKGVVHLHQRGEAWSAAVDNLAATLPEIISRIEAAGSRLVTLTTHRATLEDVFVALTGRELRDA
jgi:ABC-2 type transport system ATP-binding protein